MRQYDRLKQVFAKLPKDCVTRVMRRGEELSPAANNSVREYLCFQAYIVRLFQLVHCFPYYASRYANH